MKKLRVKDQAKLNLLMYIVPLASLLFLGKGNLKRFLPASIIIFVIEMTNAFIGKKRKWWVFYNKPNSFMFNELPYQIGLFFPISLWMLKFGIGNFKKYLITNTFLHMLFVIPIRILSEKKKYWSLIKLNNFQFFLYFFYKCFLLYGVQKLFDKNYKPVE